MSGKYLTKLSACGVALLSATIFTGYRVFNSTVSFLESVIFCLLFSICLSGAGAVFFQIVKTRAWMKRREEL